MKTRYKYKNRIKKNLLIITDRRRAQKKKRNITKYEKIIPSNIKKDQ